MVKVDTHPSSKLKVIRYFSGHFGKCTRSMVPRGSQKIIALTVKNKDDVLKHFQRWKCLSIK